MCLQLRWRNPALHLLVHDSHLPKTMLAKYALPRAFNYILINQKKAHCSYVQNSYYYYQYYYY